MRITKWIDIPSVEMEISISSQEAANAIMEGSEDWLPEELVRKICNDFLTVMQKIPDTAIAAQTPAVRKIIADVMEAQALRFRKEFPR